MASHEDIFLDERTWFTSAITQVLKKLRRVLRAIQDVTLEDNEVFEHVSSSSSLEELFSRVGPIASVVLHGLLSDEEWKELHASDEALASRDMKQLINARLGRQARFLGGLKQSSVRFANKKSLNAQQQHEYAVIMKESKELLLLEDREDEQDESSQSLSMQVQAEHKRVSKEPVKKKQRIDDDAAVVAPVVAPSSPIREVVLVESEAEAERSEDQHGEHEDREDIAQMLEEAAVSVNTVVEMLRWYYSVAGSKGQPKLDIGKIEPPNSDLADPDLLRTRRELVTRCLNEEQSPDECRLEQWAKLLRFWRFVKRAFVIVGIFANLEKTKPRGGTTMAKRFTEALRKLKCTKPISYAHALNYRSVGEFLLEYPRFVYQLRLTKLKDWNARIEELKEMVIAGGNAWSLLLDFGYCAVVEEEEEECCSQGRGRILKCSDCGNSFHECCAGYDEGSVLAWSDIDLEGLSAGVTLSVKVYCQECLESREFEAHSVARRIAEVVAVAKFFNAEGCRFRLQPVKGDGYCLFGILEKFARQHLEFIGSADLFCKNLAKAALESFERLRAEIDQSRIPDEEDDGELSPLDYLDEAEQESVAAFTSLRDDPIRGASLRVKSGLWEKMEAQHVIQGFATVLYPNRVVIHSYQARQDGVVMESGTYGTPGADTRDLYVFHWGSRKHYDSMVLH